MSVDLTKLQMITANQGFKNNNVYTGSFTISGNFNSESINISQYISLPSGVDTFDVIFSGRSNGGFSYDTGNPRPNGAWFKSGVVNVRADGDRYSNYPIKFRINSSMSGNTLIISAVSYKDFTANLSLTPETVYYKVIDYSLY